MPSKKFGSQASRMMIYFRYDWIHTPTLLEWLATGLNTTAQRWGARPFFFFSPVQTGLPERTGWVARWATQPGLVVSLGRSESSDVWGFFFFFASQTLHNRFFFKKKSGEVKDSVIFPFCSIEYFILYQNPLTPHPLKPGALIKPSVLELLYRVFYTPTHGQKHGATQRIASQQAEVIVKQKKEKNAPPITTLSHTH